MESKKYFSALSLVLLVTLAGACGGEVDLTPDTGMAVDASTDERDLGSTQGRDAAVGADSGVAALTEVGNYDISEIVGADGFPPPADKPCGLRYEDSEELHVEFRYDREGRVAILDEIEEGVWKRRMTRRYGAEDRLDEIVQIEKSAAAWGIEVVARYRWESQTRLATVEFFRDGDSGERGEFLYSQNRTYATERRWTDLFVGPSGRPSVLGEYTWDAQVATLTVEKPDLDETTTHYFERAPQVTELYDWPYTMKFEIDAELDRSEYVERGPEGPVRTTRKFTYEDGRLVEVEVATAEDSRVTQYVYTCSTP